MKVLGFLLVLAWATSVSAGDEFAARQFKDPVKTEAFWGKQSLAATVSDRVKPAPRELVQFLVRENVEWQLPETPKTGTPSKELISDVGKAIEGMPESIRGIAEKYVVGVFLVQGLGSTAFTDWVHDEAGTLTRVVIALDEEKVNQNANDWATWKENTPFLNPARAKLLTAVIEDPANDNRVQAIQYILLHELGHVVGAAKKLHPEWAKSLGPENDPARFPFSALSWKMDGKNLVSNQDPAFPFRAQIQYYRNSEFQISWAGNVYDQLSKTNFPTLYAATSPFDDFAESFANYVHVVLMKKTWSIEISSSKSRISRVHGSCWSKPRCAAKMQLIQETLKSYETDAEPSGRMPAGEPASKPAAKKPKRKR